MTDMLPLTLRIALSTAVTTAATASLPACSSTPSTPPAAVAGRATAETAGTPRRPSTGDRRSQAAAPRFTIDPRLTLYRPPGEGRPAIVAAEAADVVEHPIHGVIAKTSGPPGRAGSPSAGTRAAGPVRLLPEDSSSPHRFAVLTVPHVILRTGPIDAPGRRDNLSELTRDEELWLLDRTPNDGPPVAPDADRAAEPVDAAAPAAADAAPTADAAPAAPAAGDSSATRPAATQPTVPVGPAWLVHSSDGYLGWVNESHLRYVDAADFAARLRSHTSEAAQAEVAKAIEHAKSLAGTPYLWGGKTAAGIDCSGLMQASYAAVGVRLPRDADMQSSVGRLVATRWFRDGLVPGDLLFFLHAKRGHVHHVAMYVGGGRFVESAKTGVAVRSLDPADPDYEPARDAEFGWARRVVE